MSLVHSYASLTLSLKSLEDKVKEDEERLTEDFERPPVSKEIDGFYAWVIVAASFIGHVITYGIAWTVGIFYVLFLAEFRQSPVITSWVGTINSACTYLGGPISSALAGKLGGRTIITLGCLISSAGLIMSAFARNIYFLMFSFSIVTGLGLGIAYVPIVTTVGCYFDKYRNAAIGIAVAGIGFGTFIYPTLINTLVEAYTWRGAFIFLSGLNLHLIIIACIMRDPAPPPQNPKEVAEGPASENIEMVGVIENCESIEDMESNHTNPTGHLKPSLIETLQLDSFTNPYFLVLLVSNFFSVFGLSIVYIHLNSYAETLLFTQEQSSMLLSVIGMANLIGRIFFGFIGQHPKVNPMGMYSISFIIMGGVTLLCPLMRKYWSLMTFSILFGFLSAPLGTIMAEMIIAIIGVERLATAFGYQLAAQAIGFLIGAPIAGSVLEMSGTYNTSFFLAGGGVIIGGALILIPWNRINTDIDEEDYE